MRRMIWAAARACRPADAKGSAEKRCVFRWCGSDKGLKPLVCEGGICRHVVAIRLWRTPLADDVAIWGQGGDMILICLCEERSDEAISA